MLTGPIAPGEIVCLLGPGSAIVPDELAAASLTVLMNGIRAPILYQGSHQVNAIVPFGIESQPTALIEVQAQNRTLAAAQMPVSHCTTWYFHAGFERRRRRVDSERRLQCQFTENPAARGGIVMVFATGFGQMIRPGIDGESAQEGIAFKAPVNATIADKAADVLYAGSAPGLVAGMAQINYAFPLTYSANLLAPLVVRVAGVPSQDGLTLAVR